MRLNIFNDSKSKIPKAKINKLFKNIKKEMFDESYLGSVNIIFSNDKEIKALNKNYRGKDKATDVLSFNMDSPVDDDSVFGEIYLSIETASKQAKKLKVSLDEEYLRLICHGLLHLLGYDHKKKKDFKLMMEYEEYYLRNL